MKSASITPITTTETAHETALDSAGGDVLPEFAPNDVTAGIDWASADHAVCIVDSRGRRLADTIIDHSTEGIRTLIRFLTGHGVGEVAIERADGPVVDAVLGAGLSVVVICPNQVKNLRARYGSAGNKDDRFDAYVLADTLRTDRARLRPLVPDTPATIALRRACRARKDLVKHRVAATNQLRAHLQAALPGAIGLFTALESKITLAFLTRFDTQERVDWLTPARFSAWLTKQGYTGRTDHGVLHQRLLNAPRGATGQTGTDMAVITASYVTVLATLVTQINALSRQIDQQLAEHADAHIFTSLPRSGRTRAARLLAEIGDCRARFPTPESLICLAGAAPSTRQSGRLRIVSFRYSCDKQLRDAVTDFANGSRDDNPWAADLYNQARARGHEHAHAIRILARAWLRIIWHCWQNHTPYDPTQHRALQRVLTEKRAAA